jgi:hypothetical protein
VLALLSDWLIGREAMLYGNSEAVVAVAMTLLLL